MALKRTKFNGNGDHPITRRTRPCNGGGTVSPDHSRRMSGLAGSDKDWKALFPFPQLTLKQSLFVQELIKDFNITRAARDAGYSPDTAHVIGKNLLKTVKMRNAIKAALHDRALRTQLDQDKIICELACIAFADLRHFLVVNGNGDATVDLAGASPQAMRAVQEITQDVYVEGRGEDAVAVKRTRIKLHPKLQALEQLSRHLGLINDKLQLDINQDVNVNVRARLDLRGQIDLSALSDAELALAEKLGLQCRREEDGQTATAEGQRRIH